MPKSIGISEAYVLGLCDEVLGVRGMRQYNGFDWLRADPARSGRRGVRLRVDSYWPDLGLVVEYNGSQHEQPVAFFDKPDRLTVSGVHRGLQRALYDARRAELIPAHGLRLVVVRPPDLTCTALGRMNFAPELDKEALSELLAPLDRKRPGSLRSCS